MKIKISSSAFKYFQVVFEQEDWQQKSGDRTKMKKCTKNAQNTAQKVKESYGKLHYLCSARSDILSCFSENLLNILF